MHYVFLYQLRKKENTMKKYLRLSSMVYVVLVLTLPLLLIPKGDIVAIVNGGHTPWWDLFFTYTTQLGDGVLFAAFILVGLLFQYRLAMLTAVVAVIQTVIVQGIKNFGFKENLRPRAYFESDEWIHFVEGVTVHMHNSFPSGHSASAFVFAMLLAWSMPKRWHLVLCLVTCVVALSRVYLAQHFFIDIWFGALLGVVSFYLGCMVMEYVSKKYPAFYRKTKGGLVRPKKDRDGIFEEVFSFE